MPPKEGMQSMLQGLGVPTVTIISKPQIRVVLENPGHRIAGTIHKNLECRMMAYSLRIDTLEEGQG